MQLDELRGFARTVPPLIEADRQTTWDIVASSPGDPDEDIVDAFGRAAGEGTGGGFANFGRTVYADAVVLGWEVLRDYLALHLAERERSPKRLAGRRTARDELERKLTGLSFAELVKRYSRLGIVLDRFAEWDAIRESQFTRNAIVHNLGRYTREYFEKVSAPRYPSEKEMGWNPTRTMAESKRQESLVDREDIPLDFDYVSRALTTFAAFARAIKFR